MDSLEFRPTTLPSDTTSNLRSLLFRDSYRVESPSEIIQWWERRRIPFNIAVGTTGLVSLTFLGVLGSIGPQANDQMLPPAIAVIVYAIGANLAYTGGWITELLLRPIFGPQTGTVGATIFRYGLAFSVGLTALPIGLSIVAFCARVLEWLF
jgi:hypothetical protein